MKRVDQQSGFSLRCPVRAALLLLSLLVVVPAAQAQDRNIAESKEYSDNVLGATQLFYFGFDPQPGFAHSIYYAIAFDARLFTDLTPRLSGSAQTTACVAALWLSGTNPTSPYAALGLFRAGEGLKCWELFDPDVVRPLKKELFPSVRDERGMPTRLGEVARDEYESEVFNDAILKARSTRPEAFDRAVKREGKEPEVTYANLMRQPASYRGDVVRIEGNIRRVRKDPKPALVHQMAGIEATYECWLINDEYGPTNPVCIITTELPPGLSVNEKIIKDNPVAFVGYFFKKYRFEAGTADKPKLQRDAPLLVGYIIPLRPIEAEGPNPNAGSLRETVIHEASVFMKNLLIGFLGLVGLTVVVVGGLSWWFHKGDAAVRARVLARPLDLPEPDRPPDHGVSTGSSVIPLPVRRSLEQPPPN